MACCAAATVPPTSLHGTSVSPGRLGAAQRASVPKTRVFVRRPQHREGFGAFQAALRESIMSILAGAILDSGPMRSAGQHGFKDEHGAGGLVGRRNGTPMMSMMLASWASIIGCVYQDMRIPAR